MKTIESIVDSKLCHGCGFCATTVPENKIEMVFSPKHGHFIPQINQPLTDSEQKKAVGVCPAINTDYLSVIERYTKNFHHNIGNFETIYTGYSTNESIHKASASGGVGTEILLYLLETKKIDGAIVTVMDEDNPFLAKQVIARSKQEILDAQQSKYAPVNAGRVIELLKNTKGKFAITLQPCHIQALRILMKDDKLLRKKLPFIIVIFCSRAPKTHGVEYILEKKGIDPNDVKKINFRNGEHHLGHMSVFLKDGREVKVKHLGFDYWGYMFINFFTPVRCYMCPDKLSALADISIGDNWTNHLEHENGSSVMVVRNKKFINIIEEMTKEKRIKSFEINDANQLIWVQNIKQKTNIAPRKFWWELFGGKSPDYGKVTLSNPSKFQYIKALPQALRVQLFNYKTDHKIISVAAKLSVYLDKILALDKIIKNYIYFFVMKLYFLKQLLSFYQKVEPKQIKKLKKYKIVIIGGYGSLDIGDEAMPKTDIINLKQRLGEDLEILMLSSSPENTSEYHLQRSINDLDELAFYHNRKIPNFVAFIKGITLLIGAYFLKRNIHLKLWPNARSVLLEIQSADLIFNVGGGNLNSFIPQELYKKGFTYLIAHILGKPVVISGQTMGPYEGFLDTHFARFVLNKVNFISFRDKVTSLNRLKELGVNKPILKVAADDAMALPFEKPINVNKALNKEFDIKRLSKYNLVFGMNLKGSLAQFGKKGGGFNVSQLTDILAKTADSIIDRYNGFALFIATDYHGLSDDRKLHDEIISKMKNAKHAFSLQHEYDDVHLKGIINICDFVLGARYHYCVFAAGVHTPFLGAASGIYQMTKLHGLCDLLDLPQSYYEKDLIHANAKDLTKRAFNIIENREKIKNILIEREPELSKASLVGINHAIKLLTTKSK